MGLGTSYAGTALSLLSILGCNRDHDPRAVPATPSQGEIIAYDQASARAESRLDQGYVVSWDDAGGTGARNQGDALIWTGELLASVPCADGAGESKALQDMISALHGGFWRYPSLANEISLDGALGAYRGIAHRVVKCGEGTIWEPYVKQHLDFMADHAGRLNPGASPTLEAGFSFVRDALGAKIGLIDAPSADDRTAFEGAVAAWAAAVKLAHQTGIGSDACFRIHVGLMAYQTVEELGYPVRDAQRDAFCEDSKGWDLPTTNHWCGRDGLPAYLNSYQENQWQYRHQRCPAWEAADGDGWWQPGTDYVRGLADQFAF